MNKWSPLIVRSHSKQDQAISNESLLDIFTLLSFVLIIASFIYATQQKSQGAVVANIEAHIADHGSSIPPTLPNDELLIVVYRTYGYDKIMVIEGAGQPLEHEIKNEKDIKKILDEMIDVFKRVKAINLVMHKGKEIPNASIIVEIQHWLSVNKLNTFKFYMTGNSDD